MVQAVRLENEGLVKCLLEKGANIKQISSYGYTVFHMVSNHKTAKILRLLAEKFISWFIYNSTDIISSQA